MGAHNVVLWDTPRGRDYWRKVVGAAPQYLVSYLPVWDAAGPTAQDQSGNGRTGTYSGVTLNQAGIGDGRTSGLWDASNDYLNWYSASLAAAFNGAEGALLVWDQVAAAGVWTDATARWLVRLAADGNNDVSIQRTTTNNQIRFYYNAGGTFKSVTWASGGTTAFVTYLLTWSRATGANGEMKAAVNGVQQGATQTALGTWVGALAATMCCVGATSTVPAGVWSGYGAHAALWCGIGAPAAIWAARADLAVV